MTKREMLIECREVFARYALGHRTQSNETKDPARQKSKIKKAKENEKMVAKITEVLGDFESLNN